MSEIEQQPFADNPIKTLSGDKLSRTPGVEAVAELISTADLTSPLTLGVFGGWGTGKTSFLNMLKDKFRSAGEGDQPTKPDVIPVVFEAWPYASDKDALWRAMVFEILKALKNANTGNESAEASLGVYEQQLYRSLVLKEKGALSISYAQMLPSILSMGAKTFGAGSFLDFFRSKSPSDIADLADEKTLKKIMGFIQQEIVTQHKEQIQSVDGFRRAMIDLIRTHVTARDRILVVMVDDLDRCQPDTTVAALEAIKSLLDLPGCAFVLALDRAIVESGIELRYPQMKEHVGSYLDKIIQVPVYLKQTDALETRELVDAWWAQHCSVPPEGCSNAIYLGASGNLRTLKRTLNAFRLSSLVLEKSNNDKHLDGLANRRLAQICVISVTTRLFDKRDVADTARIIQEIEKRALYEWTQAIEHSESNEVPIAVYEMMRENDVQFRNQRLDEIERLIRLARGYVATPPSPENA